MNERYAFLRLPLQKYETFSTREQAEARMEHVKQSKRFSTEHRSEIGTNGYGTWWIKYTVK
jgi:hypothetical protein